MNIVSRAASELQIVFVRDKSDPVGFPVPVVSAADWTAYPHAAGKNWQRFHMMSVTRSVSEIDFLLFICTMLCLLFADPGYRSIS